MINFATCRRSSVNRESGASGAMSRGLIRGYLRPAFYAVVLTAIHGGALISVIERIP